MNVDSVNYAMAKDNPTFNAYLWDEVKTLPSALKFNVGQFTYRNDFSKFSSTTLTQTNIDADIIFNQIVKDEIQAPLVTSPDFVNGWAWYSFYLYNVILNETIYKIDMISDVLMHPSIMDTTTSNYAVRLHHFVNGNLDRTLIYSIVDIISGTECYRVTTNESAGKEFSQWGAQFLRNVRRVKNGVVDLTTPLTFADEMKIISCIPFTEEGEYNPYLDYIQAIHIGPDGKLQKDVNKAKIADATTAYQGKSHGFPFRDGFNGNLVLLTPRMIAVDKPDTDTGNYLFGWSFLPWNNSKYYLFDTMANNYKGINPLNADNFMTILKLILLGVLFGEIIGLFTHGKLSF